MGGYAAKQSADFAALFKEVREKLSKTHFGETQIHTLFFCLLLFGTTFILLFLQFAAKLLCQKKRRKIPSFFSNSTTPLFVCSQRKHLLLQFNHTFLAPKGCIFFFFFSSNSISLFLGGGSQGRMHFVLQLKSLFWVSKDDTCCSPIQSLLCLFSLSLSLSLSCSR